MTHALSFMTTGRFVIQSTLSNSYCPSCLLITWQVFMDPDGDTHW